MFYKYSVKWDFDGDIKREEGLVNAICYANAVSDVMELFSEEEVYSIEVTVISDNRNMLSFSDFLDSMRVLESTDEPLGPQIIEALQEALAIGDQ